MLKLWLKWMVLVWVNAIIGLIFSDIGYKSLAYDIGVVLGVCLFIPIYVMIENYAIKTGNTNLQTSLLIGVIVRACLQAILLVDVVAGIIAMGMVNALFGLEIAWSEIYMLEYTFGFWHGFLTTIIMGGILSALVALLTLFIMLFMNWSDKKEKVI